MLTEVPTIIKADYYHIQEETLAFRRHWVYYTTSIKWPWTKVLATVKTTRNPTMTQQHISHFIVFDWN